MRRLMVERKDEIEQMSILYNGISYSYSFAYLEAEQVQVRPHGSRTRS